MAKNTKKNSKESTEETKTTETPKTEEVKVEPRKLAPEVLPGLVSVAMTREEIDAYANLLSITAKTFEKLAMQAAQENDEQTFAVLKARYQLSYAFAEKLARAHAIPEPESRDFH